MDPHENAPDRRTFLQLALLINAGWLGTNIGLKVAELPLNLLLSWWGR